MRPSRGTCAAWLTRRISAALIDIAVMAHARLSAFVRGSVRRRARMVKAMVRWIVPARRGVCSAASDRPWPRDGVFGADNASNAEIARPDGTKWYCSADAAVYRRESSSALSYSHKPCIQWQCDESDRAMRFLLSGSLPSHSRSLSRLSLTPLPTPSPGT